MTSTLLKVPRHEVCALNTGRRVGELFNLQWSDVDLEKNILNVFAPKTGKTRPVPINADARGVLEAWALGRKNDFRVLQPRYRQAVR
jgi:integrase